MREDGSVVRARAVREVSIKLTLEDLAVLRKQPHNPTSVIRSSGEHDQGRGVGEPEKQQGDHLQWIIPRRVLIGATSGCTKFLGVVSNDQADRFVHHSESGRYRMEKLMRQDDKYYTQVERAERRQVERLADTLERRALEETKKAETNEEQTKRRRTDLL